MYETRRQLLRKINDLVTELDQCEIELESEPGSIKEINRRLDRLEEAICSIIGQIKEPVDQLFSFAEEIYGEQAAAKGDKE
jgi:hypothetical protein